MASRIKRMSLDQWTTLYDRAAKKQGWSLFDADGTISIHKIDEPEQGDKSLRSDLVAVALVYKGALEGDVGCAIALFLDGKETWEAPAIHGRKSKYAKYEVPA